MVIDVRAYEAHEELKDGRSVYVRSVKPEDKATFLQGVSLFSEASLYKRFHGSKSSLTDQELKYYSEIDYLHHVALIVILEDSAQAIGGGRFIAYDEALPPQNAELSFAVVDEYQGMGVGTVVLKHLIHIARDIGIRIFEAEVLMENAAMIKVFEKSGLSVAKKHEGRTVHVTMNL